MGSHDSTGADFMQLFVSDRVASPPEYASMYSEKLLVTPDSFFINEYTISRGHVPPLADSVYTGLPPPGGTLEPSSSISSLSTTPSGELGRVTREDYGLPRDGIIMCNFNQLFKVDPLVFAAWMGLLEKVPSAYLWMLRLPSTAGER
jgi:protein O-GlcNAc transferase